MSGAACPSCGKQRDLEAQRGLLAAEEIWAAREPGALPDGMRKLALRAHPRWFRACDACLRAGRALAADVRRQHLGMGTPFAAYVARPFRCEDCRAESAFSPEEQRHWFEELGFLIWVYPKQCAACRAARRRKKRANQLLAEALANLDDKDASQLEAVARLYEELGSAKAATFRARAKKRR